MELGRCPTLRWEEIQGLVRRRVRIDRRALAALRMSLATLLLVDLALRARNLRAFYTDAGVLPRALLCQRYPVACNLSLHALTPGPWLQAGLFLGAGLAAVALLVGYRTRWATAVSLLLLVSLHARNPGILSGGDSLFRRLLFWGLLLPLGSRWSVDAWSREPGTGSVANLATAGYLVQVVAIYAVNAALKLRNPAWWSGAALRRVLQLDQFTVFLGPHVAGHPTVLVPLARLWISLLAGSVLLLVLWGRARTALVALFAGAHIWMLATMRLGIFPLVSLAALLPFLPSEAWDRLEAGFASPSWTRLGPPMPVGAVLETTGSAAPEEGGAGNRHAPRLQSGIAAAMLATMLIWNTAALGAVDPPARGTGLDPEEHRWEMFADPHGADVWYTAPGRLASGEEVAAFHGSPVPTTRAPSSWDMYPTARWRKYLVGAWSESGEGVVSAFAGYLCTRWERRHETELAYVEVRRHTQRTDLDGEDHVAHSTLVERTCL